MNKVLLLVSVVFLNTALAQVEPVAVVSDEAGYRLQVSGENFLIKGMNWGYIPVGYNYSYDLWSKPPEFIEEVLHREMSLLQAMGVNAIRLFNTIPPKWVTWIRDEYGIYTAINHLMGRYGFEIDGAFVPNIDYNNPRHRSAILTDLKATVERYKDVRGVLLYLLGNENNYGLHWTSFEIEAVPGEENNARAEHLYTLLGEAATLVKSIDKQRPVSLTNGDLQYIDLIAKHCKDVDIMGSNVYRGPSMRDLYDRVKKTLKRPVLFSEFGADAYNAKDDREDHRMQADMLLQQWQEIYEHTAGRGRSGTAIGGFVFQWSDGWWKHKQHTNLDVHDTTASWPNGGYPDFQSGQNNMNEEWFGITAKSRPDADGFQTLEPRAAYYALKYAWRLDPYSSTTNSATIGRHFGAADIKAFGLTYDVQSGAQRVKELERVRISDLRMVFDTNLSTGQGATKFAGPATFDHTESFFPEISLKPNSQVTGRVALNIVGNVAQNRLNPIFYENRRDRVQLIDAESESFELQTGDRVRIYAAEFQVRSQLADLEGFYRVGHYHWGDEGDLFGLYREAYYGPNLDIYDGVAPVGFADRKGAVVRSEDRFWPRALLGQTPR